MKADISSRKDIELMVNSFYDKVKEDDTIGYFFNSIVKVEWEKHLPKMYDFWEGIVLGGTKYAGNPIQKHILIHQLETMEKKHFNRWIELFNENLNEHFEGLNTELARQRALSIATVMQIKIKQNK